MSKGFIIRINKNNGIELALVIFLFYESLISGINWIFEGIWGANVSQLRPIFLGIVIALIILELPSIVKRLTLDILIVVLFFILAYLVAMLNSRTLYEIIRQSIWVNTFFEGMPIYILLRASQNYKALWRYMNILASFGTIVYVAAFSVYNVGATNTYRTFSTGLILFGAIFIIDWYIQERKLYLFPACICVLLIATCGRRSSLVALALLWFIICIMKRDYKMLFRGMAVVGGIIIFWTPLLQLFYNICVNFDVRPRILTRIMSGTISDDSHRFEQWSYVFELLNNSLKRMLFGLGIAGERSYLLSYFAHMQLHGYPHDIFVEMLGHYGYILGSFFCVMLVFMPFCAIKFNRQGEDCLKITLFAIAIASQLIFQDSYLQNKFFFLFLSIGIGALYAFKSSSIKGNANEDSL